ncbi:hypothetical protein ACFWAR_29405 [Streptomyces sp. NPDC059917]|uniref:hypothetical protein n=1 Tax=Streptomyces sp. NPDC059917 TaxID=3347002 RepID=UPI003663355B
MLVRPARSPRLSAAAGAAAVALLGASGCAAPTAQAPPTTASPSAAPSAAASPAAPLTADRLLDAALVDADVPQVKTPVRAEEAKREPGKFPPVADPVCRTYVDARNGEKSFARVRQVYDWKDALYPGGAVLASYEAGAAERTFADLKKALAGCRSFEAETWTGKITVSLAPEPDPRFGDEAVTLREHSTPLAGSDVSTQITVVRAGNTIATFTTMDVDRSATFPPDLIERQTARLKNAQHP